MMFFNEGTVTFDGVLRWGDVGHRTLNYETWQYMRNGGWIDRESGTTNFLLWPGPVWQFESRLRTNTGPNDIVYAGSLAPVATSYKKPSMMFRPTSTNGSAAWIFVDDFDATKQSTVNNVDTLWGKNNHTIYTDNTYTERLRITAGPDGGLSFNGRFIVNGKDGLTTNVLAGETRLDITNGVIVGVTLNEVLQLTPRTITNSNDSTWGKGAGLICVDANYIYISTGTNTWKRAALGW
jgi:hypothetical protein